MSLGLCIRNSNNINFLIGCHVFFLHVARTQDWQEANCQLDLETAQVECLAPKVQLSFLLQISVAEKIQELSLSPGNQPLAKEPEESGYEIDTSWEILV